MSSLMTWGQLNIGRTKKAANGRLFVLGLVCRPFGAKRLEGEVPVAPIRCEGRRG